MAGLENPVYSRNVIEFVTVANEFCKYLENSGEIALTDFIDTTHRVLPLLYLKATLLPKMEESFEEFNEKFVTEDDYNLIQNNLLNKFKDYNSFEELFDPLRQQNDEPAQLSIAENFADIYQDLKDFLMQYRSGTDEIMTNALWECRQSFEQYWGQRVVNILRVLHYLKYTVVDLEESTNLEEKQSDEKNIENIDASKWFISRMQKDYRDEE